MTSQRVAAVCAIAAVAAVSARAAAEPPAAAAPSAEVAAWQAFCDSLRESGTRFLMAHPQRHAIDRAESTRYLAQQIGSAVELALVEREPELPLLRINSTSLRKWGLDGADAKYQAASIEAGGSYRVRGQLGNAALIAFQVYTLEPDYTAFASLSGERGIDLPLQPDGRYELRVSAQRPADWKGPWLELDPRATTFLIREYFDDWDAAQMSRFQIERLDPPPAPLPLTPEASAEILERAARLFAHRIPMWIRPAAHAREQLRNRLSQLSIGSQALHDNIYGAGWFALEPGQALLIEFDAPEGRLWSFQLGNFWWESLDYLNHTGSLNSRQAVPSSDGHYRIVVSLEDPGVPNWLDPAGHPEGYLMYRYQRALGAPVPEARLVRLADLAQLLPAGTRRVSAEERRAELARRRAHAAERWTP